MKRLYVHILVFVLGLIVLAQVAVAGIFYALRGSHGAEVVRDHVHALTRYVVAEIGDAGKKGGEPASHARLRALGAALRLRLTLRDGAGAILAHEGPALPSPKRADRKHAAMRREHDGRGTKRFVVVVPYAGGTLSLSPEAAELVPHGLELIGLFVALLALVGLLLLPLARRITRPLRELEETARAIAAGELSRRAPIRGKDEIASLARAFNGMTDRLASALQQEKDLIAAVSHELRAPLARLRLSAELLQDPGSSADGQRHARSVADDVESLDALIDELLLRARLGSAAFELEEAPVELGGLCREVAERAVRQFPAESGAPRAVTVVAPLPVVVRGNATLLSRALRNLVENALAYSPADAPVELRVEAAAGSALVSVQDHGIGIPDADRDKLFEPFFRGAEARKKRASGVGFGLTLTREIASRHGGSVELESEAGRGTVARLRLPLHTS